MTNRREFLQTGVSVSALPLAVNALLAPGRADAIGQSRTLALHTGVIDDRYAEGRLLATTLGRFGVPLHRLPNGDVTRLWSDLDQSWRARPAAIAGFTQFGPMFALEQLGRERGLRVALRVEHRAAANGALAHAIEGPAETLALAEHLGAQDVEWPVLFAALLARCGPSSAAPARRTLVTPGSPPVLADAPSAAESVIHYYTPLALQEGRGVPWDGPLFSWVIAPRPPA